MLAVCEGLLLEFLLGIYLHEGCRRLLIKKKNHPWGRVPYEFLEEKGNYDDSKECATQSYTLVQPHGLGSGSVKKEATTPKRVN